MFILRFVPFFLVVLVIYNLVAFLGPNDLSTTLFGIGLISGASVSFSINDILIFLGMFTLYFEILKATKTSAATIIEHTLSMIVFILFLIEFLVVQKAGTSTFLIITFMSLLDVVAGFTITISTAKRDFSMGDSLT